MTFWSSEGRVSILNSQLVSLFHSQLHYRFSKPALHLDKDVTRLGIRTDDNLSIGAPSLELDMVKALHAIDAGIATAHQFTVSCDGHLYRHIHIRYLVSASINQLYHDE